MTPERWGEIKTIFQHSLDLPLPERDRYLDEACRGNPSLLSDVKALLVSSSEAEDFIEKPALATEAMPEPFANRVVGQYRLIEMIGEGGMGAVYRAVRDADFKQEVAIKLVKRGMDTDFILRRFRAERQILARLDHPNIARLIDGGVTDDGLPYFVMEYLANATPITNYCESRLLPRSDRLRLFLKVCAAVHYAHQNLVVHRDIKTSNILVTPEGDPKLLDFGIAKLLDRDGDITGPTHTATGMRLMTPDYASPEQVRGELITTSADIYSLGVLLYELIAGHRPYYLAGKPPHEIARVITETDPPGLGTNTDLDNIVSKAMHKDSTQRYSTVEQFADDIRRHLDGRPVIARTDTIGYRAAKFVQRHRTSVAAAAIVLFTFAAGVAAVIWQAGVASAERTSASQRFFDLRDLANSFLYEIDSALVSLPGSTRARELLVKRAVQYLDKLAREADDLALQRELVIAYEKLADVQGGPRASNLGDSAGALENYRKGLTILEKLSKAHPANVQFRTDLARYYMKVSDIVAVTGDYKSAYDYDRKGLDIRQEILAMNPASLEARQEVGLAYHEVASDLGVLGDWTNAVDYRRRAYATFNLLYGEDPSNQPTRRALALAARRLGRVLSRTGDTATALKHHKEALDIEEADLAQTPNDSRLRLNVSFVNQDIGDAYFDAKRFAEALPYFENARDIRQALASADSRDMRVGNLLSTSEMQVGNTLIKMGLPAKALDHFRKALSMRESLATIDPLNAGARGQVAESHAALGDAYKEMGQRKDAADWYERSYREYGELKQAGKLSTAFFPEIDRIGRELSVLGRRASTAPPSR